MLQEIERLKEENGRLRGQLGSVETVADGRERDRKSLEQELARTRQMLTSAQKGGKGVRILNYADRPDHVFLVFDLSILWSSFALLSQCTCKT